MHEVSENPVRPDLTNDLTFTRVLLSPPLSDPLLGRLMLWSIRVSLLIFAMLIIPAALRNYPDHTHTIILHLTVLLAMTVLALGRLNLSGRGLAAGYTVIVTLLAMTAIERNGVLSYGVIFWMPVPAALALAIGVWGQLFITTAVFSGFALQLFLQTGSLPSNEAYWVLWGIGFSSVCAALSKTAVSLLNVTLKTVARDKDQIEGLLAERQRISSVMSMELKQPVHALSMLLAKADGEDQLRGSLLEQINEIRLVADNLTSSLEADIQKRPISLQQIDLNKLINQVRKQLETHLSHAGAELIVDVSDNARISVWTDRFRLRTVINNLLRSSATFTDGHRIWLNVDATILDSKRSRITIQVDDNGHGENFKEIAEAVANRSTADLEFGSNLLGVLVARDWLSELFGDLQVAKSPHGGIKFQISLTASVESVTSARD